MGMCALLNDGIVEYFIEKMAQNVSTCEVSVISFNFNSNCFFSASLEINLLLLSLEFYVRRYDERSRDFQSCCCCDIFLKFSFLTDFKSKCQYLNLSLLSVADFGAYPIA